MKITCGMILFSYLNGIFTGLFTAKGDSRTPFLANVLGLGTNMILDPLLIFGIGPFARMEAAGAAIATVTAQVIVTAVFLVKAVRDQEFLGNVRIWEVVPVSYMKTMVGLGLPSAIQNLIYAGISMVLTRFVAVWGDAAVAVQRVGSQIESISWMTADGFAASINSFAGQNFGGKRYDRVQKGYFVAAACMFVWGTFCSFLLIFGAQPIFRLFYPGDRCDPYGCPVSDGFRTVTDVYVHRIHDSWGAFWYRKDIFEFHYQYFPYLCPCSTGVSAAADASWIKWRVVGVVLDKCGKRNYLFYCILKGFKEPDSARRDKLDAKQKKADIMSGIGRTDDNASAFHCHGYE